MQNSFNNWNYRLVDLSIFLTSSFFGLYDYIHFFLVGYVEERLWWPIQSPNIGGKKKASSLKDREIRSSSLILDLKDGKL